MTQPPPEPDITPGKPLWATPPAEPAPSAAGPPTTGPPPDPDRTTVMPAGDGQPGGSAPPGPPGAPQPPWQQAGPGNQPPAGPYGQAGPGGPGGPPPFGGPGQPGPPGGRPPRKGNKGLLIGGIAGGVALVLILGVLGFFFLGGGSPADSVESYLTALKEGDEETAKSYVCAARRNTVIGLSKDGIKDTGYDRWTIVGEREIGSLAEVDVDIAVEKNATISITFVLIDENGWKLCDGKARKSPRG